MPSKIDPSNPPPEDVDLDVHGTVPPGLSGRLVGIGHDGVVHSLHVRGGRVTYRRRRCRTEAVVDHLVAFEGSIVVFGEDAPAYELSTDLDRMRPVDLAGHGRALGAYPKLDPATGELHLVARDVDGVQAHVVVSAGALTRHSRVVTGPPARIEDLALSCNHTVFVADGWVGVEPRNGGTRVAWIATGTAAPHPVHAHDAGDAIALLVVTPAVERWLLHPGTATFERVVLDETARRFAHLGTLGAGGTARWAWTTGRHTIARHDLSGTRTTEHSVAPQVVGDFAVVADAARPDRSDAGWLLAFVHHPADATTALCVLDTADIARPPVATVRIPRPIPRGLRCTWVPPTPAPTTPHTSPAKENPS